MAALASYFKQQELSDIDVTIYSYAWARQVPAAGLEPAPKRTKVEHAAAAEAVETASPPAAAAAAAARANSSCFPRLVALSTFPGHRIVLFTSEFFQAQAKHWPLMGMLAPHNGDELQQRPLQLSHSSTAPFGAGAVPGASSSPTTGSIINSSSSSSQGWVHAPAIMQLPRPPVTLFIDQAEQLPAAEAVIAALYGVPDAVSKLQQQQLVHAVLIADMVHVPAAAEQAVAALKAAAQLQQGPSAAALETLAGLTAWPACLLQLLPVIVQHAPCCRLQDDADLAAIKAADPGGRVQRLLAAALGDLEAVWADPQLKALLLGLPLPAMQLLLSSDQLRVAAEDTVLYTAATYTYDYGGDEVLAPLVRLPQLSRFSLAGVAHSVDDIDHIMHEYAAQVRSFVSLLRLASPEEVETELVRRDDIPASWRLGPRKIRPLAGGVRLEWRLPVQQLREACSDSFARKEAVEISSPECSPPLGGLTWKLHLNCQPGDTSMRIGVTAEPDGLWDGMYYTSRCILRGFGKTAALDTHCSMTSSWGEIFAFSLGETADGWDEAAWAAAGQPANGELLLQLQVLSVE